jgi:hypothetical protein
MVYSPPSSFKDALADAQDTPSEGPYRELEVRGVGMVTARKPMANAVGSLGNAMHAKISEEERNNYIGLFVVNHLSPDSWDDLVDGMMAGKFDTDDAVGEVCKAISTWGTARPTRRWSR